MSKSRDLPFGAMRGAKGKVRSDFHLVIHELFNRSMYDIIYILGYACPKTFFFVKSVIFVSLTPCHTRHLVLPTSPPGSGNPPR